MFWNNFSCFSEQIAFVDDNGISYAYKDIDKKINQYEELFDSRRNLIFLECANNIETLSFYIAALRFRQVCLLIDSNLNDELKRHLTSLYKPNFVVNFSKKETAELHHKNQLDLDDDLAILLSTSGSTGSPKLVKLSYENLLSNAKSIATYLDLTQHDKAITLLPLHYSFGLSIINSHLLVGGLLVVTEKGLFDKEFWQLFKNNKVTSLSGVPFIYEMLKRLRIERMDLPSLRYMTQAGGKLSSDLIKSYAKYCKDNHIDFFVMYGQTEATARISYLHPDKVLNKPESIGVAIPGGKLALLNEKGKVISEADTEGELVYTGPNVMLGYATEISDLAETHRVEILKTGDLAKFDQEGDFYITGRMKRFIKMYGLRYSLDKIESDLRGKGFECACGGEDNNLIVALVGPEVDKLKQLISSSYNLNKNNILVMQVEELSKTSSGKINYNEIFK